MRKRSIIWTMPKDELQEMLNNSNALIDIIVALGFSRSSSGSYVALKKRIEEDGLDISILEANRDETYGNNTNAGIGKISLEDILIENSSYSNRTRLKIRLIRDNIIVNQCKECGMLPVWNGKSLVMVLDHINGTNNDNRLENLRLLCPNCNSQQDTFSGKNKK